MSVLVSANCAGPEDFHEVARLGSIDIVEVSTEPQLVKQTRSAWAICVPAAPNAFPIALVANDQTLKGGIIQIKLTTFAQSFDRSDKHQIRCAGTKARPRGNNKKFSRLEMCRGLQTNLRKMGNRVTTALWHLPDLLEDQVVAIGAERELWREADNYKRDAHTELFHGGIRKRRNGTWQRLAVIPSKVEAATQRTQSARPGFQSRGPHGWSFNGGPSTALRFAQDDSDSPVRVPST